MVYVDDPLETFREFRRILKPGGKAHAIDSDVAMVAIDPLPPQDWRDLLDAAGHAFRTPNIGHKLDGLAHAGGFSSVDVNIMAAADTTGRLLNLAQNIAGYAREVCTFDEARIQQIIDTEHAALEVGTYFAVSSILVVIATV